MKTLTWKLLPRFCLTRSQTSWQTYMTASQAKFSWQRLGKILDACLAARRRTDATGSGFRCRCDGSEEQSHLSDSHTQHPQAHTSGTSCVTWASLHWVIKSCASVYWEIVDGECLYLCEWGFHAAGSPESLVFPSRADHKREMGKKLGVLRTIKVGKIPSSLIFLGHNCAGYCNCKHPVINKFLAAISELFPLAYYESSPHSYPLRSLYTYISILRCAFVSDCLISLSEV